MASSSSAMQFTPPFRHIEYHEIENATDNFADSSLLGRGGFGKVYKGNINSGSSEVVAAFKRMYPESIQGPQQFQAEVQTLSRLRHCNIVALIGYCDHGNEKILVYEYMPRGTLQDHLHTQRTALSWLQRLNICITVGRGLHYLHDGTDVDSGVIHGDVKSANVLLHESMEAKISDFGLARTCSKTHSSYINTGAKGTFGYIDPTFFDTGKLRRKSDVYSFGVLMLEVLCRKPVLGETIYGEGESLVTWSQARIKHGSFEEITDSDIWEEIHPKCLKKFVTIAESCLQRDQDPRPTMAKVLEDLTAVLALQVKLNGSKRRRFGCF
ncbi:hypothetical protein QVD17_02602 [Tagetes erecta]|uniref:non-specific serine/threonine protein kinase n=1 Tax=Tagetes erecta TaxID=13708 RepID=A0AAD8P7X9_TARER|nr:hypothetical protein QVD17_02602 [Tagetes erecta]